MAESIIALTPGSGVKAHTWNRTIGANSVEDEFTLPGEYPLASYVVTANSSVATVNDHQLQIMAGSSLNVRIRRIEIQQSSNATTAAIETFNILRLTTAGTGGTSVTPRPFDTADAASGATAMTLPSSKGTEGVTLFVPIVLYRQTVATAGAQASERWVWQQHPGTKPIIIPAGTSNGIAIKNTAAIAGGGATINIEFVETSFV